MKTGLRPSGHDRQAIQNLKGEIEFREILSRQHVSGENLLLDYYPKEQHDRILLQRMADTEQRMRQLLQDGVRLSPFLELGAERGQRSLVLANDFQAVGVAVDISYHQLRTMDYFSRLFQKEKLPLRICCDANHLPFRSHSFPFIFCYEFLHHFPALNPILQEIHRVLSGGHFFFDEEPYKRLLKVALYRQKHKIYSEKARRKSNLAVFIESFISEPLCDETAYGIIENNDISLSEWVEALSIFQERTVELVSVNNISSQIDRQIGLQHVANLLLGGRISGLCRKSGRPAENSSTDVFSLLGCPACEIPSSGGGFDRPPLIQLADCFICSRCGCRYPSREGILFLLPHDEFEQLYPDFAE